jgi:hypothetical protein
LKASLSAPNSSRLRFSSTTSKSPVLTRVTPSWSDRSGSSARRSTRWAAKNTAIIDVRRSRRSRSWAAWTRRPNSQTKRYRPPLGAFTR